MASKRSYWLMKSEPEVFSIQALRRDRQTHWDGVRNYQARNHLRSMGVGDLVLFYHSNAEPPGVAGGARGCPAADPPDSPVDGERPHYDGARQRDQPPPSPGGRGLV